MQYNYLLSGIENSEKIFEVKKPSSGYFNSLALLINTLKMLDFL